MISFLLIQLVASMKIKPIDYCYHSKTCSNEFSYSCSAGLCSRTKLSCQGFKLWAIISYKIKKESADRALEEFFHLIQDCPAWSPSSVCLNDAVCYHDVNIPYRFKLSGKTPPIRKQNKCKCTGKYSYTCGRGQNYCALDKGACHGLNAFVPGIKKCKK